MIGHRTFLKSLFDPNLLQFLGQWRIITQKSTLFSDIRLKYRLMRYKDMEKRDSSYGKQVHTALISIKVAICTH